MERTGEANWNEANAVPGGLTRRRALRDIGAAGLALSGFDALLNAAAEAAPKHGSLADIDHVVILIQENRSFDHYFGTYAGVRGFADKHGHKAFFQKNLAGQTIQPWHLPEDCLPDLTHDWGPQHRAWNGGAMNRFVVAHEQADKTTVPETMGYYDGADVPFYRALADAFTLCDGYHCSVIGPTDPNRLMSISASIDPAGHHGGPIVQTSVTDRTALLSHKTMPESLQSKGITWKAYTDYAGGGAFDSVFTYFKQFNSNPKLKARALTPTFPADFMADVASGRLPQVSWLHPSLAASEHPGYAEALGGEIVVRQVLEALVAHPKIWRRTALFITWDENGGFFDHVAPPVAPKGTPGEYLTVATLPDGAQGIRGPIGLGFRVPALVVSPFSRGGLVCPDTFDHTSMLRFLETRFRARVPNLSAWRRKHTGDLTSAFNFAARPSYGKPSLPKPAGDFACSGKTITYTPGAFPKQAKGKRRRPSGIV